MVIIEKRDRIFPSLFVIVIKVGVIHQDVELFLTEFQRSIGHVQLQDTHGIMYPKTGECSFSLSIVMPLFIFQCQKSTKRDVGKYQLSNQGAVQATRIV